MGKLLVHPRGPILCLGKPRAGLPSHRGPISGTKDPGPAVKVALYLLSDSCVQVPARSCMARFCACLCQEIPGSVIRRSGTLGGMAIDKKCLVLIGTESQLLSIQSKIRTSQGS